MSFVLYLVILAATAIGAVLAGFVGSLGLDLGDFNNAIPALIWFLIAFVTYYAGTRMKEQKYYRLLSFRFILAWLFCTVGYLLGFIVWVLIDTGSISANLDTLIITFFFALPLTIGPTATASLGMRD